MKKYKVGLIGLGRISDLHVPGYRDNPDAELYALCDTDPEVLAERAAQWDVPVTYGDYRELLADDAVDAVEVLTPHLFHEQIVLDAARAGKQVCCQKPMTMDLASADRMIRACREAGVLFKVTDNYLFYPPLVKAKELIEGGRIGEVNNLRIKMIGCGKGGWEVPQNTWEWRQKETEAGRGQQTFDHGHHLWAVAWYLLGAVSEVKAWIDVTEDFIDSPAVMMWRYKEKNRYGQCEYTYSRDLEVPSDYYACDEWFEITGSKGILKVNRCNGKLLPGPALSLYTDDGWEHLDLPDDWSEGFTESTLNFTRALAGREAPSLTGEEAREILAMDLAIGLSSRENRTVSMSEFEIDKDVIRNK